MSLIHIMCPCCRHRLLDYSADKDDKASLEIKCSRCRKLIKIIIENNILSTEHKAIQK